MGNLSSSSSDHSAVAGANSANTQYSPIHRELGAILKEDCLNIPLDRSNNPDDYQLIVLTILPSSPPPRYC